MEQIIRERLNPNLTDFTYLMTRSYRRTMERFKTMLLKQKRRPAILDLGCGDKPFRSLFPKTCRYVGVDLSRGSAADVIADIHRLPFKDNSYDAVIASEVLEHSANEYQVIKEFRRVAKNNTLVYLTLPLIFPEHGQPDDYQRLTQYKLKDLFRNDELIMLQPTNGLVASVFIFFNLVVRTYCGGSKLLTPLYVVNNLFALVAEALNPVFRFINRQGIESGPIGYSMIVRIKK